MPNPRDADPGRRVSSGFPDPADVPGPTEQLRRLHGDVATEPAPPKFGRTTSARAGTDDVVTMDDMVSLGGAGGGRAADAVGKIAARVVEESASRLRAEFERRGLASSVKVAELGAVEIGGAALLSMIAVGALGAAATDALSNVMPRWAAGLTTFGLCTAPAAALTLMGRRQLRASLRTATGPARA
jgi:hypothetical protein